MAGMCAARDREGRGHTAGCLLVFAECFLRSRPCTKHLRVSCRPQYVGYYHPLVDEEMAKEMATPRRWGTGSRSAPYSW